MYAGARDDRLELADQSVPVHRTAVGLSDGWEVGCETERWADGSAVRTTPIAREARSLEGYLRFGGVIEL